MSLVVILLLVISTIDLQITKNLPQKIKSYKIDRNGIHIDNQVYAHEKLRKTKKIDTFLDTNEMFFIVSKKPLGKLKLEFSQLSEKDKITKALEHYAKNL